MTYVMVRGDELYHHGIKGQKWGIRRYQNPDGTLTEAGLKRYGANGSEYLASKAKFKAATKAYKKKHLGSNLIRRAGNLATLMPGPAGYSTKFAADIVANLNEANSKIKLDNAKKDYILKRHDMLQETGRRKALKGPVQTRGEDELNYGYRGAKRIAQRQNKKGMTRKESVKRENTRKTIKAIGKLSVAGVVMYDRLSGGKVSSAVVKNGIKIAKATSSGIKAAKKVWDDYYNVSILDASGKVIKRYHDACSNGEDVARLLLTA